MPIINIIDGDLIDLFTTTQKFDAIAHGANCFHTMGAGIAKSIADRFPEAFSADVAHHTRGDLMALGQYSVAKTKYGHVINIYSQFTPGRVPADGIVKNVGLAFAALNSHVMPQLNLYRDPPPVTIGIPLIGAGIAGGNWDDIAQRISLVTPNIDIVVVNYKPTPKD